MVAICDLKGAVKQLIAKYDGLGKLEMPNWHLKLNKEL
jgi:hypothetical protein